MNTKKLLGIILLISVFSFTSCEKDDEIDINQLVGKWYIYNDDPNLAVDGSVTYTFNDDKTCSIDIHDFLSDQGTTLSRTYIIGHDNTLVTLYDEENKYTEQYYIRKLTTSEMVWENASPSDGNSDKKLRKTNE